MQLPFRIYTHTGEIIFPRVLLVFGERPRKGERRSPSGLEDERPYLSLGVAISQTPRHISAFHSLAFLLSLLLHRSFPFSLGETFLYALYLFNADAYYCVDLAPSILRSPRVNIARSLLSLFFVSTERRISLRITEIFRVISVFRITV